MVMQYTEQEPCQSAETKFNLFPYSDLNKTAERRTAQSSDPEPRACTHSTPERGNFRLRRVVVSRARPRTGLDPDQNELFALADSMSWK